MNLTVHKTNITITNKGIKPIGAEKFLGNILNSSNFKIYILKIADIYLYVGKTNQPIGKKFQQGFRSFKKDSIGERSAGYGGYKWIKKYINKSELQLYVFDLGELCTDNNSEAIEAEIVFKIRENTSKWPECQNEIHFFNDFEDAKSKAEEIYRIIS